MGFLIDTNVLAELRKGERGDPGVQAWYAGISSSDIYVSVIVLGEIRRGRSCCVDVTPSRRRGWTFGLLPCVPRWAIVSCPFPKKSPIVGAIWGFLIRCR